MSLTKFRQTKFNCDQLREFLGSPTGRELSEAIREERKNMTADKDISELRLCGRHDVFQRLDEIFFAGVQPIDPPRKPESKKARKARLPLPHHSTDLPV